VPCGGVYRFRMRVTWPPVMISKTGGGCCPGVVKIPVLGS